MDLGGLPEHQLRIIDTCHHPTGALEEFDRKEIEQSVPARFEKMAAKHAGRLAVKERTRQLTYRELDQASNRIAHGILARSNGDETPIAILVGKTIDFVVCMLGILKAGHPYVPVDCLQPVPRLRHMLADSGAFIILADDSHLALANEVSSSRCTVVCVSDLYSSSAVWGVLAVEVDSRSPAWIVYTSGSTGRPKGVVQTHRNVLHFAWTYNRYFHICPEDKVAQMFSFSANAAGHATVSALLNGASLILRDLSEEGLADTANWIDDNAITVLNVVPTVFRNIVKSVDDSHRFHTVRLVTLLGEQAHGFDVEKFQQHFGDNSVLVNRLGSTETGSALFNFIDKSTEVPNGSVPVGYPTIDHDVRLLNENDQDVGIETAGEIVVASEYVSPGYWRNPVATNVAFKPETGKAGRYYSGDIGLRMSDGSIRCLGRKDYQVNVMGHRIEPAEIESELMGIDAVKAAAVVGSSQEAGPQRLIAYIAPNDPRELTVTSLRKALSARLPAHMIPSVFVFLDKLPTAPNGKVHRALLPAPGNQRPRLDMPFVSPGSPAEKALAAIWREVLSIDRVGVNDHFMDLGGNSLLAAQVLSRVIQEFRVELPLRSLMEAPTIADMALLITENRGKDMDPADLERILQELEYLQTKE